MAKMHCVAETQIDKNVYFFKRAQRA